MNHGDKVRVKQDCREWEAREHRGRLGQIVQEPVQYCTDYHKAHYETRCEVRFGPGDQASFNVRDLEPADAVSTLAELGRFLPTEADIGRAVVYYPPHGGTPEDGVITGLNDSWVFVRYRDQHPGASGKATRYEDLRWLA